MWESWQVASYYFKKFPILGAAFTPTGDQVLSLSVFHFPLCPWTVFVKFSLTWQACIFGVTSLRAVKCRRHCGLLWYHRFSWQALPAKSGVRVSGVALIPFRFWISCPVMLLDLISRQPCHAARAWHHELWNSGLDVSSGEPFEVRKSPRHDHSVTELALVKTTKASENDSQTKTRQKHVRWRVSPKKAEEKQWKWRKKHARTMQ